MDETTNKGLIELTINPATRGSAAGHVAQALLSLAGNCWQDLDSTIRHLRAALALLGAK